MGIKPKTWNRPSEGEIEVSLDMLPEEIQQGMSQADVNRMLKNKPSPQALIMKKKAKLHYMPRLEDILGENPIEREYAEREARKAHERKMIEQARRCPMKADKSRLPHKRGNAWRELYLELKVREYVVDEYYRQRYENEIVALHKQLESMKTYIGRYDPSRRYPMPKDFEKAVIDYFDQCDMSDPKEAYTIPDLLLFLGMNKTQWKNILTQGPQGYTVVAEMAMLKIEGQRNRQLLTGKGQMSGHIADLNHHFEWGSKKDEEAANSVTNNLVIVGAPPEPKSIEEWSAWYTKTIGAKRSDELQEIDVTPSE